MSTVANPLIERMQSSWAARYLAVRRLSETLCETLEPEDCCIQSMPDVSPTRWHLAHTTWFFETFILAEPAYYKPAPGGIQLPFQFVLQRYRQAIPASAARIALPPHGRPGVRISPRNRRADAAAAVGCQFLIRSESVRERIELGLNHEQQHQELMLTDIKHVLSCNPMFPTYRPGKFSRQRNRRRPAGRTSTKASIGSATRATVSLTTTNRRGTACFWKHFASAIGWSLAANIWNSSTTADTDDPELWLSEGWGKVQEQGLAAPLVLAQDRRPDGTNSPLPGLRPVEPSSPFATSAISRPMRLPAGPAPACRPKPNGKSPARRNSVEGNSAETSYMQPAR